MSDQLREWALDRVMCPRCEARPGQGCVSISGGPTTMHSARIRPLWDAYELGAKDAARMFEDERGVQP